jgi:hypothetical protein
LVATQLLKNKSSISFKKIRKKNNVNFVELTDPRSSIQSIPTEKKRINLKKFDQKLKKTLKRRFETFALIQVQRQKLSSKKKKI